MSRGLLVLSLALASCSAETTLLDTDASAGDASSIRGDASVRDASTPDAAIRDAAIRDAASSFVELGTGDDAYEPLTDGQLIELVRGPQGGEPLYGFHVWAGLRAVGFEPESIDVAFTTDVEATGERLATSNYQVNLERAKDGDGWVTFGLRMILSDCCKATRAGLVLRVMIADARGQTGEDERRVVGGLCNAGLPNQPIDACPQ
ncbi:hypothetical protein L6R52_05455 [Myxococcota bacterium]|nr:hypothetical protein [Myxococcota bacterium]